MTTHFQTKPVQPKQNQQAQNQGNAEKSNPFRAFFLQQREVVEALVNDNIKRKYPSFAAELIADFARTVYEDKTKEPYNLKNTSSSSMIKAIKYCARKGLSLSQEQVYLAYFKGNLTPMIGINGYRELLRRNNRIIVFQAGVRREKDLHFSIQYGAEPDLKHTPNLEEDSPIIGSYATARLREGGLVIVYCNRAQLDEARNKSKSSWAKTLWEENPESMSKVLPLRKLGKELGVDVEDDGMTSSDHSLETKSYSDNVVPFVPSANYNPQSAPDYDYDYDYEGQPS